MHANTSEILDQWKSAEASAREAERRLAAAWEHFERTRTEPPSPDLFEDVTLRRRLASERLSEAMRALRPTGQR
jgi:hypothetical protein